MDYDIRDFVSFLREGMEDNFPIEPQEIFDKKHKNRKYHMVDVAFKKNPTEYLSNDLLVFDIGNEEAEKDYPYYHILEDSPVIRKRGRSTVTSRGSQQYVKNLGQRNYSKVSLSGKMFRKEYGDWLDSMRKAVQTSSFEYVKENGKIVGVKKIESDTYFNSRYHYIENILGLLIPSLESTFNIKYKGASDNGLVEEYFMQEYDMPSEDYATTQQILGILGM